MHDMLLIDHDVLAAFFISAYVISFDSIQYTLLILPQIIINYTFFIVVNSSFLRTCAYHLNHYFYIFSVIRAPILSLSLSKKKFLIIAFNTLSNKVLQQIHLNNIKSMTSIFLSWLFLFGQHSNSYNTIDITLSNFLVSTRSLCQIRL